MRRPELRDDEWHPVLHQAGNVVNVPREAIKLGDDYRGAFAAGQIQGG
jgi:hypothetical protein